MYSISEAIVDLFINKLTITLRQLRYTCLCFSELSSSYKECSKQIDDIYQVHIGTPIDKSREINQRLLEDCQVDGGYASDVFDNLVYRYEEPNGMARWDSPLFTVLYDDEAPPFSQIWDALIGAEGETKIVQPNQATISVSRNFHR